MSDFTIDPLIAYTQQTAGEVQLSRQRSQINWDLRESSVNARHVNSEKALTFADLTRPATCPPVNALDITCGLFPSHWLIRVRRPESPVTVSDVMEALSSSLLQRVSNAEYTSFTQDQQARIAVAFNNRWLNAPDQAACRSNGILRLDCLLQHTVFAGLTPSPDTERSCILTLRRQPGHSRTPSAEIQPRI